MPNIIPKSTVKIPNTILDISMKNPYAYSSLSSDDNAPAICGTLAILIYILSIILQILTSYIFYT